jgi:hypothetical protein
MPLIHGIGCYDKPRLQASAPSIYRKPVSPLSAKTEAAALALVTTTAFVPESSFQFEIPSRDA